MFYFCIMYIGKLRHFLGAEVGAFFSNIIPITLSRPIVFYNFSFSLYCLVLWSRDFILNVEIIFLFSKISHSVLLLDFGSTLKLKLDRQKAAFSTDS